MFDGTIQHVTRHTEVIPEKSGRVDSNFTRDLNWVPPECKFLWYIGFNDVCACFFFKKKGGGGSAHTHAQCHIL
jgi:hypothetical protein